MEDVLFNSFFKGKRVLVTGHTGFKGAWLALWLAQLGAKVTGYSLKPPTEPSMFEALGLEKHIEHVEGDVRDGRRLKEVFDKSSPQIAFHMAAQPLVLDSYDDPVGTIATNVMGTVNFLEACRKTPSLKSVVCITSDKCYENRENRRAFVETDPLGGRDPYSASKACAEIAVSAYRNSFFSKQGSAAVASTRAGNVIGGGDWAKNRLVCDCARFLSASKKIQVRRPNATRAWQHVLEPLSGYMLLSRRLYEQGKAFEGGWNFGPSSDATVETVVRKIIALWKSGSYAVAAGQDAHEAGFLNLDSSKARRELGWKACLDLDESLSMTVEWYKAFYCKEKQDALFGLSVAQISRYSAKAKAAWK